MQFKKKVIQPLPYPVYLIPVLILCLVGLFSSIYLAHVHYKNYTDITFSSACAITRSVNCDTVAQSGLSILFDLPLAYYAIYSFALLLLMTLSTIGKKNMFRWNLIFHVVLIFSFSSLYYGYLSATKIKSYCLFCLTCYAAFFAITFYSFLISKRFALQIAPGKLYRDIFHCLKNKISGPILLLLVASLLALQHWIPHYWQLHAHTLDQEIAHGVTEDHHPWIGAREPKLVIHEYTDYLCFQCYKMHFFLRRLIAEHPDSIRLVHHNFPLDNQYNPMAGSEPYHVGAGKMALVAIRLTEHDKFWEVHDQLYKIAREGKTMDLKQIGKEFDISADYLATAFYDPALLNLLKKDIYKGIQHGMTSTPSFVIEEKTYSGTLPEEILERAIKE